MTNGKFQLICDGSCDLPLDLLRQRDIHIVPYYVSFDGEHYQKEAVELPVREFYRKLVESPTVYPKTSMPSVQDFCDAFQPYVSQGIPVLCICMTALFSGSFQSAQVARDMLAEQYPDTPVAVVDSTYTTALEGSFVLEAARMRDDGLTLSDATAALHRLTGTGRIFFTVGSMAYLLHGGRAGKLAGRIIDRIDIKPIICMKNGEIYPAGIQRSRLRSMERSIDLAARYAEELGADAVNFQVVTGYGYDPEEGEKFNRLAAAKLGPMLGRAGLDNYQIGATLGAHTGPHPLGIGFLRYYDR